MCRRGIHRTIHRTGGRRLRHRIEPCASHQRRGAIPRRVARCRFRSRIHGPANDRRRASSTRTHRDHAGEAGRAGSARALDRGEAEMTYRRPADRIGALRLHLNENTGGCSELVLDAIRQITAEQIATYPDYAALSRECAEYLGVREAQLVLTNGLDEGLLAATVSGFSATREAAGIPEAIVPEPAFEMYSVFVKAAGGRVVPVAPRPGFEVDARDICDAISDQTRLIFLTNPNNPTGQLIPREVVREIARSAPSHVTIMLDEAYFDFCGETFLAELD